MKQSFRENSQLSSQICHVTSLAKLTVARSVELPPGRAAYHLDNLTRISKTHQNANSAAEAWMQKETNLNYRELR
jgi:hypothetical protein